MALYRHLFLNPQALRLTVILAGEMQPPWRQPGEAAEAYVRDHAEHSRTGPWELVSTEPCA